MKVKLTKAVRRHGDAGDEVELPDFLGAAWVARGLAEEVEDKPTRSTSKAKKATGKGGAKR